MTTGVGRLRPVPNPVLDGFHSNSPLRQQLGGSTVVPRAARSVRVHRLREGKALSRVSDSSVCFIVYVMTETRPGEWTRSRHDRTWSSADAVERFEFAHTR